MTDCNFLWLSPPSTIGKEYFKKVKNSNLLQDPSYGYIQQKNSLHCQRVALIHLNGQDAGFFQLLETKIMAGALHFVMLDRGPLWFDGLESSSNFAAFCEAFRNEFPCRPGRFIRFIPEINDTKEIQHILQNSAFKQKKPGYQTIWVDLHHDKEVLRANLKKNWRADLRKSKKAGVQVEWDTKGRYIDWMLRHYALDKSRKKYSGPSVKTLHKLCSEYAHEGSLLIGRAIHEGRPISGILILCHGQSATYQIGWNSALGREKAGHNILLWKSLLYLKDKGLSVLDLGGINDETAKGIQKFKSGLGGRSVHLAGLYS